MAERDTEPKVMLADNEYDTDDIRSEVRARGATLEIPSERNRGVQHTVNRSLYAMRNRIERFFNRLKECRRVATRCGHSGTSLIGFVKLAAIKIPIRFVHATWRIAACGQILVGRAMTRVCPSLVAFGHAEKAYRLLGAEEVGRWNDGIMQLRAEEYPASGRQPALRGQGEAPRVFSAESRYVCQYVPVLDAAGVSADTTG